MITGVTSTGGLTALVVKKLHAKTGTKKIDPTTKTKGGQDESNEPTTSDPTTEIKGQQQGSSESRVAN
jgi:hypothetical protein